MTPHALCLVGGALSEPKIESLRSNLSARGIVWGGRQWLNPGYALDLYLEVLLV